MCQAKKYGIKTMSFGNTPHIPYRRFSLIYALLTASDKFEPQIIKGRLSINIWSLK